MDNLTHTLVGGALAAGGLSRRTALATPTLLIGANLPDLDALTYFVSPDQALYWRRGWTHGVLALVVLPLLLTAAMMLWERAAAARRRDRSGKSARVRPGTLLGVAYVGVLSHPFLDWLNTYGIRLLMPFDRRWFYGDTLYIIDPWLWLLLGGALFLGGSRSRRSLLLWAVLAGLTTLLVMTAAALTVKVPWLIAIIVLLFLRALLPPSPRRAVLLARTALAGLGLYLAFLMSGSALAERRIRDELAARDVAPVEDLMVGPVVAAPLRRDVVIVTPDSYRFGTWDWLADPRFVLEPDGRPRPDLSSPVVAATWAAPSLCGLVGWARYPFVEIDALDDGYEVHVLDARYARHRRQGFGTARVRLDHDLHPVPEVGR